MFLSWGPSASLGSALEPYFNMIHKSIKLVTLTFHGLYPESTAKRDVVFPVRISKGVGVICSTIRRLMSVLFYDANWVVSLGLQLKQFFGKLLALNA